MLWNLQGIFSMIITPPNTHTQQHQLGKNYAFHITWNVTFNQPFNQDKNAFLSSNWGRISPRFHWVTSNLTPLPFFPVLLCPSLHSSTLHHNAQWLLRSQASHLQCIRQVPSIIMLREFPRNQIPTLPLTSHKPNFGAMTKTSCKKRLENEDFKCILPPMLKWDFH